MSVRDNCEAKKYTSNLPYPLKPKKDRILSANVTELSDDEIAQIPRLRAELEASVRETVLPGQGLVADVWAVQIDAISPDALRHFIPLANSHTGQTCRGPI